ncbi:MAG: AzlC family ABC transporter permease [Actinomycetota bacterium]
MSLRTSSRELATASVSVGAAITVFGAVYGATAAPLLGGRLTLVSSVLVFSGAAQFTMVALAANGAGTAAILGAVTLLGLRHLPLGALVRQRITSGRGRRAFLSWFLVDETASLSISLGHPAERTLLISGVVAYLAWLGGTAVGVAGVSVAAVEPLAEVLFPVLFVGLAALTAADRDDVLRAVGAALATGAVIWLWPQAGAPAAVAMALGMAVPRRRR